MKKTIMAAMLLSTAFSALAVGTVDMKVKGILTNSSCTPTLSNGGKVDFGHISLGSLSATDTNQLGTADITLTITCDSAMPVGFFVTDNRADTVFTTTIHAGGDDGSDVTASGYQFGLGKASEVNIGAYSIAVKTGSVTADGVAKDVITSSTPAAPVWSKSLTGLASNAGSSLQLALADTATVIPVAYKVGVFPLKVTAAIQGTTALGITDDTNLDGQATISIVYL